MIKNSQKPIFIIAALVLVSLSRLLPHLPNFTPIAAIALFGGAYLNNNRVAFLTTFAALFLSDLLVNTIHYNNYDVIGYFSEPYVLSVYLSFALTVFMGISLKSNITAKRIGLLSLSSSLIFWLVTNLACWPGNPLYSQDLSGLMACYIAAIPFLGNVVGDLFYNTILFGAAYIVFTSAPSKVKA